MTVDLINLVEMMVSISVDFMRSPRALTDGQKISLNISQTEANVAKKDLYN
jgi:hypothetical protein